MTLPTMDGFGNLHRTSGPGGGQFAMRPSTPPALPLGADAERLRARVRLNWRALLDPLAAGHTNTPNAPLKRKAGGRAPGAGSTTTPPGTKQDGNGAPHSFIANVSVPMYSSIDAPVTIVVAGTVSGTEVAREYRSVDGQLFRQVWGLKDDVTGRVTPVVPRVAAWAPTEPGRAYELRPVPADEVWLRSEAERRPVIEAESQGHAEQHIQQQMDDYASIDGNVWRTADAPTYRAPVVDDAPFDAPLRVEVVPAPSTQEHAADLGYFHADQYEEAVDTMRGTAGATGASVAVPPEEPPITWLRELGLVPNEPAWRQGVSLDIEPSDTLTEESFRDRLTSFREQIVSIPGAVTGDVGSFLVVGGWKLDFAALTRQQQDEYRRHIMFGVEHGLI